MIDQPSKHLNAKRRATCNTCLSMLLLFAIALPSSNAVAGEKPGAVLRCGWWDNPTPGNVWFTDKDGEWTVAMQGMYEAEGKGPDFKASQQVDTNGPHGHGCACMQVETDAQERRITKIISARAVSLRQCRSDRALKEPR